MPYNTPEDNTPETVDEVTEENEDLSQKENPSQEELKKLNTPDLPVNRVVELEKEDREERLKEANENDPMRTGGDGSVPGIPTDPHDPEIPAALDDLAVSAQAEDDASTWDDEHGTDTGTGHEVEN